jgi:Zn-dependent protease
MSDPVLRVLFLVPVFLFSLCVHEYAHAWVAVKRGDMTPALMGRLSMHPMAHADIVGTLLLPIICIYNGWPFFGWAKPVPIDYRNMKHGRTDMALVAAAGPVSNFILALLSAGVLAILTRIDGPRHALEIAQVFAVISIQVNLMLGFFNLIPIPPLDGFMIVQGFMTSKMATKFMGMARYGTFALLLLLFTGGLKYLSIPVTKTFKFLVDASFR